MNNLFTNNGFLGAGRSPVWSLENSLDLYSMYGFLSLLVNVSLILVLLLVVTLFLPRSSTRTVLSIFCATLLLFFMLYLTPLDKPLIAHQVDAILALNNDGIFSFNLKDSAVLRLFVIFASGIICLLFLGISDNFFSYLSDEVEFPMLILFCFAASIWLFAESGMIGVLIAIEAIVLASYVIIAYERGTIVGVTAGIRYFLLGSVPSGLLVLGFALVYAYFGVLGLNNLSIL